MATWSQVKAQQDAKKNALTSVMVGTGAGQPLRDPDPALYTNQARLYQRLSWVYGAVSVVSSTTASLANLQVYTLAGEKKAAIYNHPFEQLLRAPNPYQYTTRFEFVEALIGFLRLNGNAYIYLNAATPTAPPAEMWILRPDRVLVVPDKEKFVRGYVYEIDNQQVAFDADEVVHFRLFHPLDDFAGLSAIEALSIAAESDYSQAIWNKNFFSKDNAKPQGALAYADTFDDDTWNTMKQDVRDEHGGTKRRVMMLRGVGAGGVQWLGMGVSQKDMEFLQGRQFSKEEIYGILAPGLSQMIDKNATQANSVAGEKTFREYALYPLLTRIAEMLTAKVMPRYGENLVAEFDEIRIRDINLELAERAAYERTHTINEVRLKFDKDDVGLPDERGDLLPAQVTPQSGQPQPEMTGLPGEELLPPDAPSTDKPVKPPEPSKPEGDPTATTDKPKQDAEQRLANEYAKAVATGRDILALKALERRQFKNFCKHSPARADEFEFEHLDADEQAQLLGRVALPACLITGGTDDLRAQFADALKVFQDALADAGSEPDTQTDATG